MIAAQHATWEVIRTHAIAAVQDRFVAQQQLGTVPSATVGRELVARRLKLHYETTDFAPAYPTWPIQEDAFDDAANFKPRELLQMVDQHIRACVSDGVVSVLTEFKATRPAIAITHVNVRPPDDELAALDKRFADLKAAANVGNVLSQTHEDAELPGLLSAGLQAWIAERGTAGQHFEQDPPPSTKPALHARLRRTIDDETEVEAHWGFRGISADYHPIAVLNRIRAGGTEAGLADGVRNRRLFYLRNAEWPTSRKNQEAVAAFEQAGGRRLTVSDEDLRVLWALRDLLAKATPELSAWLVARQPTGKVAFLREALVDAATDLPTPDLSPPTPTNKPATSLGKTTLGPTISLGLAFDSDEPVEIELEALRKHTAIFAGSGSGKTVLLRRIVEECALKGVSTIVLDPNNDLARLGDPWPEPPAGWRPGDAERSREYLENTDVVIYTPRRAAGGRSPSSRCPTSTSSSTTPTSSRRPWRPLSPPLPHGPRWTGRPRKAEGAGRPRGGAGLLRPATPETSRGLHRHARRLAGRRPAPRRSRAKIAADLGQALTAATVIDPLFGGVGQPVDPA